MYVGVPLSDWVPKIMKLFKNFESRTELLNHTHKHIYKIRKGE